MLIWFGTEAFLSQEMCHIYIRSEMKKLYHKRKSNCFWNFGSGNGTENDQQSILNHLCMRPC